MIVVPIIMTYNEKENIGPMIEAWLKIAKENPKYKFEIIDCDGNSTDGTCEITNTYSKQHKNVHLLKSPKRVGMGRDLINAYKYAIEKLHADVVIPIDVDFQFDPFLAPKLLAKIDEGYDVVVASRHVAGGSTNFTLFRKLTHFVSDTLLAYYWAGIHEVKDHAGLFKAIRVKGVLDKVDLEKVDVIGFSVNMRTLYELSKVTKKFYEVPAVFGKRRAGEETTVGLKNFKWFLKYIFETIFQTTKIRLERSQQFIKFGVVGFVGFLVNAIGLELFFRLGVTAGLAAALGAELAIISNFTWNNLWTFSERKITKTLALGKKFLVFNLTSAGAVVIQFVVVGLGTKLTGDALRQLWLVIAIAFFIIPYNWLMYNKFIWKK